VAYREQRISRRRGAAQCCYCINFVLTEKLIENNWGTAKGYCNHPQKKAKEFEGTSIVMRRKCKNFHKKEKK